MSGGGAILRLPADQFEARVPAGAALAECLRKAGIALNYPCGGQGRCGACLVVFHSGAPAATACEEELIDPAQLAAGARLACQCHLLADAELDIPRGSRVVEPRILIASEHVQFALAPSVLKRVVRVEPRTIERPLSDLEAVEEILRHGRVKSPSPTLSYLRQLPEAVRAGGGLATVTECEEALLGAEAGDTSANVFGMAIDLGTTTIAASLHSLRTGDQLAVAACLNPQARLGEDVISRIDRTYRNPAGLKELQSLVAESLAALTRRLCGAAGVDAGSVYEIVVAGNAAMNHLLLGVPPETLALAPYVPVFRAAPPVSAHAIGIDAAHAEARVLVLPNIGGFVGGDTVAGLLVANFAKSLDTSLLIDIGTNCEVVVAHEGRLFAASAPAGPAMEGACIEFGMRAEPGAIDDVEFAEGTMRAHTIDGQPARGICGSGLVHAVAALRTRGLLGANGLLAESNGNGPGNGRFLLAEKSKGAARDVWLTQRDVREFQLARAAIAGAWKTLCEVAGVEPASVRQVFVAGAFGNYLRPDAVRSLGLTPSGPDTKIRFIGNSSLEGARMVLLNREARETAWRMPGAVQFVELAGREGFDETFALELALGQ